MVLLMLMRHSLLLSLTLLLTAVSCCTSSVRVVEESEPESPGHDRITTQVVVDFDEPEPEFEFESSSSTTTATTTTTTTTTTTREQEEEVVKTRQLAGLAQQWNVSDPVFTYESLGFTLEYEVSDFILDDMIAHEIYDEGCKEGGVEVADTVLIPNIQTEVITTSGEGDFLRQINVTIDIDSELIAVSNIYSESDGGAKAEIRFCHRFMLQTTTEPPIEVNFRETLITLTVDLTDGFEIGEIIVADRDRLVQTANQVYLVEAFQCTYQNRPLTQAQQLISRSQGNIIRVCVTPDSDARADGIYMRSIDQFKWERDYGGALGSVTQLAIVDRQPASNQLTLIYCTSGDDICAFESILMAMFYRFAGTVQGSGIASMQFGTSTNNNARTLRGRSLQEDDDDDDSLAAAVAEIEMDAEVLPRPTPYQADDDNNSGGGPLFGSLSSDWITPVICVLLFVILIVCVLYCILQNPLKIKLFEDII